MMGQVQYSARTMIAETIPNSIHHGLRRHAHVMFMPCECPLIWPHVMHTHMSCHANMSCNVMPMSCSWHANAHSYAHTSYTLTCNVMPTCHAMSCPCHVHGMRMPTHMPTCHAHSHVMPCQNVMQRHAHVMFMACECPLIYPHVMHTHMHAHISCLCNSCQQGDMHTSCTHHAYIMHASCTSHVHFCCFAIIMFVSE